MVTKLCRNSFGLRLNSVKHYSEVISRLCFMSGVRECGIHHADSFLVPKISYRIWLARSFEMPTVLLISRIFNRRYTNTSSWIFITLSSMVTHRTQPSKRYLISKNKNDIIDWYCFFFIFVKAADMSASTRSQNKTT